MNKIVRCSSSCILVILMCGCAPGCIFSEDERSKPVWERRNVLSYPGIEGAETLKWVLNDWENISKAIYMHRSWSCSYDNFNINVVTSAGIIQGEAGTIQGELREEYIDRQGLDDATDEFKLLSIGTRQLCFYDPHSSNITWHVLYMDGGYRILGEWQLTDL